MVLARSRLFASDRAAIPAGLAPDGTSAVLAELYSPDGPAILPMPVLGQAASTTFGRMVNSAGFTSVPEVALLEGGGLAFVSPGRTIVAHGRWACAFEAQQSGWYAGNRPANPTYDLRGRTLAVGDPSGRYVFVFDLRCGGP